MELNLKQVEIEAALRQYVSNQGFALSGRAVTITFTSGRTPSGLSALIDIGDVTELPKQAPAGQIARSSELRASDVQLGNTGSGQAFNVAGDTANIAGAQVVDPQPGNVAPEAGEAGELPDTLAPEADAAPAGDAPVSLFAKPAH